MHVYQHCRAGISRCKSISENAIEVFDAHHRPESGEAIRLSELAQIDRRFVDRHADELVLDRSVSLLCNCFLMLDVVIEGTIVVDDEKRRQLTGRSGPERLAAH